MLIALGCNENRIYNKHKSSFPGYRWDVKNVLSFNPEIKDTKHLMKQNPILNVIQLGLIIDKANQQ